MLPNPKNIFMKKINLVLGIAVITAFSVISSCTKKTDEVTPTTTTTTTTTTPTPTKTELLTGKAWKVTAATANPGVDTTTTTTGGTLITDIFAEFFDDCEKDDMTTFNTNGTTTDDEGAVKCDSTAAQTTTGSWSFNASETVLTTIDNSGGSSDTTVLTLNSLTSTSLSGNFIIVKGTTNHTITVTFGL